MLLSVGAGAASVKLARHGGEMAVFGFGEPLTVSGVARDGQAPHSATVPGCRTAARRTATGYRRSGLLHGIHLVRASIEARDTEATAHWITALTTTLPQVQSIRCRTLLTRVRTAASRQLRAAGHGDALDALRTALSSP